MVESSECKNSHYVFYVGTHVECILSLFVVVCRHYPQRELQRFNVLEVFLRLTGLNQPVLDIRFELWPDGTFNCNCLVLLLRLVIHGVYAVFK